MIEQDDIIQIGPCSDKCTGTQVNYRNEREFVEPRCSVNWELEVAYDAQGRAFNPQCRCCGNFHKPNDLSKVRAFKPNVRW